MNQLHMNSPQVEPERSGAEAEFATALAALSGNGSVIKAASTRALELIGVGMGHGDMYAWAMAWGMGHA